MDNKSKAYLLLLYLIWPFATIFLVVRFFDFKFIRNIFISLYGFLGLTVVSFGDLERYEGQFYILKDENLSSAVNNLLSLQDGKFINTFLSILVGIFFNNHHYYFVVVFMIYGYCLVQSLNILKTIKLKKLNRFGLLFFLCLFTYFLIRPISNLAFYTGGTYVIYNTLNYYKTLSKKYLLLILLAPLFHLGLTIFILLPILFFIFKNNMKFYVVFVIITFVLGKSSVVGTLESLSQSNSGTIVETKYKAYASEEGQESLEQRYADNAASYNGKLIILSNIQEAIWYYLIPLGVIIIYILRKKILIEYHIILLYNMVLSFWGIANLMLNISQGERFLYLFSFMAIGLFYIIYLNFKNKYYDLFLKIFIPILSIYCLMTLYASHFILSQEFFVSNVILEIINK